MLAGSFTYPILTWTSSMVNFSFKPRKRPSKSSVPNSTTQVSHSPGSALQLQQHMDESYDANLNYERSHSLSINPFQAIASQELYQQCSPCQCGGCDRLADRDPSSSTQPGCQSADFQTRRLASHSQSQAKILLCTCRMFR